MRHRVDPRAKRNFLSQIARWASPWLGEVATRNKPRLTLATRHLAAAELLEMRAVLSTFTTVSLFSNVTISPSVDDGADVHATLTYEDIGAGSEYVFRNSVSGQQIGLGNGVSAVYFTGSSGNDFLDNQTSLQVDADGKAGNDEFYGGPGDDFLTGGSGSDKLYGRGGHDMLHAGMSSDGDEMYGGTGNDRFYIRYSDTYYKWRNSYPEVKDKQGVDAVIHLINVDSNYPSNGNTFYPGTWTENDIDTVDTFFGTTLYDIGNTTRWMKQYNGEDLRLYRFGGSANGGYTAWNHGNGVNAFPDSVFNSPPFPALVTIAHEIGHEWDEPSENPFNQAFRDLSSWRDTKPGDDWSYYTTWKQFYSLWINDGWVQNERAKDDGWYFWSTASFARDYGASAPFEDFATVVEDYFGRGFWGWENNTTVASKEANLIQLLNSLKNPVEPTNLGVDLGSYHMPTLSWSTLVGDSFNLYVYDGTGNEILSTSTNDLSYTFTTPLEPGNYSFKVEANANGTTSTPSAEQGFAITRAAPIVSTLSDVDDGDLSSGQLSLREAITLVNTQSGNNTIGFAPGLTGTITLGGEQLPVIGQNIVITGPGANKLTISGNNQSRIFSIDGSTASVTVSISGLTIANGSSTEVNNNDGGAIANRQGNLTLDRVLLRDNHAGKNGGAIMNFSGLLDVRSSGFVGNSAGQWGGAIISTSGPTSPQLFVQNSTFTTNQSVDYGGAIFAQYGNASVIDSTIVGNVANSNDADSYPFETFDDGGGIWTGNGLPFFLAGTIVAGNFTGSAQTVPSDIRTTTSSFFANEVQLGSSHHNLIGDTTTAGTLTNATASNLVGVDGVGTRVLSSVVNPTLYYTTAGIPYFKLAVGSPALDAGANLSGNAGQITTDLRGLPRSVDANGDGTATPDIGAVEKGAPAISNLGAAVTYVENAAAVVVTSTATIVDTEGVGFALGKLTVRNLFPGDTDQLGIRNQGNAAGQIGISGGDVLFGGVKIATFSGGSAGTPLVVQFQSNVTLARVQTLMRNVTFVAAGDNPLEGDATIRFELTDASGATSNGAEQTVTVVAVDDPPLLAGFGGALAYTENQAARTLINVATLTDPDFMETFASTLTVSVTGGDANDRLEIRDRTGTADRIGVTGSNITFNGTDIGSFTGGVGTDPLVVSFSIATQPQIQALLRSLTFRSLGETPSTATRTINFSFKDGLGLDSNLATKSVTVQSLNDRPVIALGGTTTYAENQAPRQLASTVTMSDPDSPNFDGGNLTVRITVNRGATDVLAITNQGNAVGQIGVSGSTVKFGGTAIGTFTGGTGNQSLVITLNTSATPAAVQALAKAITFAATGENPTAGQRTITFMVNDGDGASSTAATKLVNVTAINDAPLLTGSATALGYTRGAAAMLVSSTFGMTDTDSGDFNTGRLLVKFDSLADAANRLEVGGAFSFSGTVVNYFNGTTNVAIGSRNTNGGVGTANLSITFNASATNSLVLQLLRNITFRTQGTTSTTQRIISFNLTDGDGGTSNTITRTVNIS